MVGRISLRRLCLGWQWHSVHSGRYIDGGKVRTIDRDTNRGRGRSGMLAEVERQGAQILDTKFEARTCPETKSSESKPKATKFACIALHTTMYQEMYPSVRDKI